MTAAKVILFKPEGKYYTEEKWEIPADAIGPYAMDRSPDFRRINNGAVLVVTQEPWGYPHLFPGECPHRKDKPVTGEVDRTAHLYTAVNEAETVGRAENPHSIILTYPNQAERDAALQAIQDVRYLRT